MGDLRNALFNRFFSVRVRRLELNWKHYCLLVNMKQVTIQTCSYKSWHLTAGSTPFTENDAVGIDLLSSWTILSSNFRRFFNVSWEDNRLQKNWQSQNVTHLECEKILTINIHNWPRNNGNRLWKVYVKQNCLFWIADGMPDHQSCVDSNQLCILRINSVTNRFRN